jgi:hypothetical protein
MVGKHAFPYHATSFREGKTYKTHNALSLIAIPYVAKGRNVV